LTHRDEKDLLNWGLKHSISLSLLHLLIDVDFVCASFALKKGDIQYIRDVLGPKGAHIHVIAKIETLEAIHNFEEILKAADGIVINRVDLSLELPPEKLMLA